MVPILDRRLLQPGHSRGVNWRGRSGRFHSLASASLQDFSLTGTELSILARGNLILWVGSAADVVNDPMSRARFRLALDCADRAFSLAAPGDEVQRMTMIWDLEGAEPVSAAAAAA